MKAAAEVRSPSSPPLEAEPLHADAEGVALQKGHAGRTTGSPSVVSFSADLFPRDFSFRPPY